MVCGLFAKPQISPFLSFAYLQDFRGYAIFAFFRMMELPDPWIFVSSQIYLPFGSTPIDCSAKETYVAQFVRFFFKALDRLLQAWFAE